VPMRALSSAGAPSPRHVASMVAPHGEIDGVGALELFVQGTTWALAGLEWGVVCLVPGGNPGAPDSIGTHLSAL